MKKLIIILFCLVAVAGHAQRNYLFVSLDISKPSTPDFVNETSANGIKLGYRFFVSDRFSVGIDFNRNTFDQYEPKATFDTGNGHLTTDYFTYIYSFGIAASGQYNFNVKDKFFPYVGLGLGALNNEYMIYYNIYSEGDRDWGFLVRPEAGIIAKLSRTVGAFAAVTYDYTTAKSEVLGLEKFSTVGVQLGLVLTSRR
jgi:opacity protein-like surface antigen